jgi:hypothetical protein
MAVISLYHQRKLAAERAGQPEVYTYDELPKTLRTQLRQVFRDAIGGYAVNNRIGSYNNDAWERLAKLLRKELGVNRLAGEENPYHDLMMFIDKGSTDQVLSAVEACCQWIEGPMSNLRQNSRDSLGVEQASDEALVEINTRFRQAGVGFEYAKGEIARIDSQLVHAEVVKPALQLLSDPRFAGAEEEFREAHRKHRSGDDKGAVTDANCAFESTLKAVCDIHQWPFDKTARGSDLLKVVRAGGLFPDYLEKSFEHMQALLTSGLPAVRNNAGSHGQGAVPKDTPAHVGAYALHLAAANIVYLCGASLALESASAKA